MPTVTDLCNQALATCGARSTIVTLNENSNEARYCRLFLDSTRDALQRAAQWNFCRTAAYLTLLKSAPGTPEYKLPIPQNGAWNPQTMPCPPWLYSYLIPADSIRIWQLLPYLQSNGNISGVPIFEGSPFLTPPMPFRRGARFIEGLDDAGGGPVRCVLTNQPQAVAIYSRKVPNPDLWDAQFFTAMVNSLAWRLCVPVSGDKNLSNMAREAAIQTIMDARITDGNEGSTNVNTIPDWIATRGYAGDWTTAGFDQGWCAGWENPSFLGI